MLHITDGESVAGTPRQSGVPGYVGIYGDLMYEGPAPAGLSPEAWRETRASFHVDAGHARLEDARQYLKSCDDALEAFSQHDETVLWLDHRLSDQLILIKALDWFSRPKVVRQKVPGTAKFSLICDQPVDLGLLTADRLAPMLDTRLPVTSEQFHEAQAAWTAFTSADPMAIESLLEAGVSALPFLVAALRRHLEEFPSVDNGLSANARRSPSFVRTARCPPGGSSLPHRAWNTRSSREIVRSIDCSPVSAPSGTRWSSLRIPETMQSPKRASASWTDAKTISD